MFYIITASADTYITNKIIDNQFKATDANVGRAGTLDLFKLYNESTYISASTRVTSSIDEISRILIKFDYSDLNALTGSILDLNHATFQAKLELFEVVLGAPTPRDFYLVSYPLSQSFHEGDGRNVSTFADVDSANFITASISGQSPVLWNMSGSGKPGLLGQSDADYIVSGTIGSDILDFGSTQYFQDGPGKISMDITKVVSASIAGSIPNHGFRISFSGSYESDQKTRFAKRFASRHAKNPLIRPRIIFTWNNHIYDRHKNLNFNVSSSLFLKNLVAGQPQNIVSGSALTNLTGQDCLLLRFVSGSGTTAQSIYVTASQHTGSTTGAGMVGVYSGTFNLNRFDTTFFETLKHNDELKMTEIWSSMDEIVGYYTGSITATKTEKTISAFANRKLLITPVGALLEYESSSRATIRLFIEDVDAQAKAKSYKLPRDLETIILDKAYYCIKDRQTGTVLVPFDKLMDSTRVSSDGKGMYIEFRTAGLPKNRQITVDLLIIDRGMERLIKLPEIDFRVV